MLVFNDMVCKLLYGIICFELTSVFVCKMPERQELIIAIMGIFVPVKIPPNQVSYYVRALWNCQQRCPQKAYNLFIPHCFKVSLRFWCIFKFDGKPQKKASHHFIKKMILGNTFLQLIKL